MLQEADPYNFYIVIDNRMFSMYRRSSHGWWSYPLGTKERDYIKNQLKNQSLELMDWKDDDRCQEEVIGEFERANNRVILTIGESKYNIYNHNVRLVKESTAIQVRDFLREQGLLAAVEFLGSTNQVQHRAARSAKAKNIKTSSSSEWKRINKASEKKVDSIVVKGNQISMDEYLKMLD
ncbi:hypothetical protein [Crassaminicella profunda]|uniref:hypothetical protein n=1 Tax=Crassaminicella profunda TaxID=1286698 RepID=UPI001CA708F0|nr:hypothetical protein [Crassaminicella profunda]QZY56689.1 hypothetical protein K7H06_07150 [Crassaminicella profunda]